MNDENIYESDKVSNSMIRVYEYLLSLLAEKESKEETKAA